jgi:CRP/FNR family transcriptional regulator
MHLKSETKCEECRQCPVGILARTKWKKTISKYKSQIWYQKGHYIFYEGNPVFGMFLITHGRVKLITRVSAKKEQIVRLTCDGHILGRQGKQGDIYANSAVAMEPSQICFIDNALLQELFLNNPELAIHVMQYYSSELRKAEKRIKILAQLTAREKVAATILYAESVFGTNSQGIIHGDFSRQEVSDISGVSPEQVSREFSVLKKQGIINSENKQIRILDMKRLMEFEAQRD